MLRPLRHAYLRNLHRHCSPLLCSPQRILFPRCNHLRCNHHRLSRPQGHYHLCNPHPSFSAPRKSLHRPVPQLRPPRPLRREELPPRSSHAGGRKQQSISTHSASSRGPPRSKASNGPPLPLPSLRPSPDQTALLRRGTAPCSTSWMTRNHPLLQRLHSHWHLLRASRCRRR